METEINKNILKIKIKNKINEMSDEEMIELFSLISAFKWIYKILYKYRKKIWFEKHGDKSISERLFRENRKYIPRNNNNNGFWYRI